MSNELNVLPSREEGIKALANDVLTLREVLYITRLSRTKIWELIRSGKLKKCRNTGRALRFTRQALVDCFGIAVFDR